MESSKEMPKKLSLLIEVMVLVQLQASKINMLTKIQLALSLNLIILFLHSKNKGKDILNEIEQLKGNNSCLETQINNLKADSKK